MCENPTVVSLSKLGLRVLLVSSIRTGIRYNGLYNKLGAYRLKYALICKLHTHTYIIHMCIVVRKVSA